MYTAFGTVAVASIFGSWLFDITESYTPAFIAGGTMATIGLALTIIMK